MTMTHIITLPNGNLVSAGRYAKAWSVLTRCPADAVVPGWDHFPTDAASVLRGMREGLHARINRHLPAFGQGRKWQPEYQAGLLRDARRVQDMARRIRVYQFETAEVEKRFGHLLARHGD